MAFPVLSIFIGFDSLCVPIFVYRHVLQAVKALQCPLNVFMRHRLLAAVFAGLHDRENKKSAYFRAE